MLDKNGYFEGSMTIKAMTDRDEAREMINGVIKEIESFATKDKTQTGDLKDAKDTRQGMVNKVRMMKKTTSVGCVVFTAPFLFSAHAFMKQNGRAAKNDHRGSPLQKRTIRFEARVADLLGRMTLDEKIGQMTQVAKDYLSLDSAIATYYLGSVLSGGGMGPAQNNPEAWADMYDKYQAIALSTRLGIPMIYGIDALHGNNTLRGAVVFPHNIGMGCTRNPGLVEQACGVTALEVAATGIDWTFSPCIAVPRDIRWGKTYEGIRRNSGAPGGYGRSGSHRLPGKSRGRSE